MTPNHQNPAKDPIQNPGQAMPNRVSVTVPARIHFGFLDLHGGLGRRLLAEAYGDAARAWGACFLRLQVYDRTPAARRFYDRLGFVPAKGHTDLFLDEAGCAALEGER